MNNIIFEKLKNHFNGDIIEKYITRLISSWCIACLINTLGNSNSPAEKEFFNQSDIVTTLLYTLVCFVAVNVVLTFIKKENILFEADSTLLFVSVFSYSTVCALLESDGYFIVAMTIPAIAGAIYFLKKNEKLFLLPDISHKRATISVWSFAFAVFVIMSLIGVFRYLTYSTPNFDFGIFAQTCYSIKTKFLALNTSERDGLISHMDVHLSPVLYLIAPFYLVIQSPAVLQIVQALTLASSVIPLYLICRKYKLSSRVSVIICALAAFYPVLTTGTFYDFHENAFLTAFILWFMYFMEKEKPVPMYIFMLLTFSVKEDAAMYMAFVGLYMLTQKGKRIKGLTVIVSSAVYFIVGMYILKNYGLGVMSGRFEDYIANENLGLVSVIFSVIENPAYAVKNCFNGEKILFIIQTLLPLMCLPLMTKKMSRFILIGPYLLINLMSNYPYQHSINFQYVYGVMALFFYLTVLNVADMKTSFKRQILPVALVVTTLMFSALVLPKMYYVDTYYTKREDYQKMSEVLSVIPDDAEVAASTFLIPKLSERDVIYEEEYTEHITEYLALDLRYEQFRQKEKELDPTMYEKVSRAENLVAVYKLKQ